MNRVKRATLAVLLGLASGAAGCAGVGGDEPALPSRSEAEQAVWRHVRATEDPEAGKPRVVSGCSTDTRSVVCAVDYERSCRLFAVTRVGETLKIAAPSGEMACVHVSGALTTPYTTDP